MVVRLRQRSLAPDQEALVQDHLDQCESCFRLIRDVVVLASEPISASAATPPAPISGEPGVAPDSGAAANPGAAPGPWQPPAYFDELRLQRPLGRGAMGQVFLAHDQHLDRAVAVKFIASEAPSPHVRERFRREARALARLSDPAVVTAFRFGEVDGRPFLVSEFIRGHSLDRLPRPFPWAEVRRIALALARGLAAAHRSGVLHRDIKPANIIRSDSGEVKLLDFGLAKLFDSSDDGSRVEPAGAARPALPQGAAASDALLPDGATSPPPPATLTHAGALVGTPMYMSPESWRGEAASPQSDLYSLGAVLYELAAGVPPHRGASVPELSEAVLRRDAPPLAERAPGPLSPVDRRFAALVDRCLHRDPAARFSSADELCQALAALDAPAPPRRLRPRHVAGLVALALALVSLPLYVVWRRPAPASREAQLRAAQPSGAARAPYEQALQLMRLHDYAAALPLLEGAVARDPAAPLGQAELARALLSLNRFDAAVAHAQQALEGAAHHSREVQLDCEGAYHEARNHPPEAVAPYRALVAMAPDNLEYGLRLVYMLLWQITVRGDVGLVKEAAAVLAALRRLPAPLRDDLRLDLFEIALIKSDPTPALARAEAALAIARRRGQPQLIAELLAMEADVLTTRADPQPGDLDRAVRAAREAAGLYQMGSRSYQVGEVLTQISVALRRRGDLQGVVQVEREIIDLMRTMGPAVSLEVAFRLQVLSISLLELGQLRAGREAIEEALAGQLADSKRRGFSHQPGAFVLARAWQMQGELRAARRVCEEALASMRDSDPMVTDDERIKLQGMLAGILLSQGEVGAARVRAEDVLALMQGRPSEVSAGLPHLLLAQVALAEGRPAEAEREARASLAGWQLQPGLATPTSPALAQAALAQAQRELGQLGAARQTAAAAVAQVEGTQNVRVRLPVQMTAAWVRAAAAPAEVTGALRELSDREAEATQLGLLGEALQARLWAGQIAVLSGPRAGRAAARAGLRALAKDAAARGFGLIAAQAGRAAAARR